GFPISPPSADRLRVLFLALPAASLPVIILGGIVFGLTTPTEAAALAVAAALFVSALYGWLDRRSLRAVLADQMDELGRALVQTAVLSGAIFAILLAAASFEFFLALQGIPKMLAGLVEAAGLSREAYVLMLSAILLAAGTVLEPPMALVLLVPVLAPPAAALGVDPVFLGTLICFNLSLGLISPPIGGCLLVTAAAADVSYARLSLAILPFFAAEVAVLAVLIAWPDLVLFGPRLFGLPS